MQADGQNGVVTAETFDIAAAAGWYSAVAGLLAGFALLAVLLPLDHDASDEDTAEAAGASGVIVFTSAFFSLLILAFTYAILSGRSSGPVAAHEQQLNGAAFGLSALLLLLGLREVLRLYGSNRAMMQPAQNLISRTTALWGPIIVVAMQFSNTLDTEVLRQGVPGDGEHAGLSWPFSSAIWINLAVSAVAIVAIAVVPFIGGHRRVAATTTAVIGRATLGFTVVVTLWCAFAVPLLPSGFILSAAVEHATVVVTAVATVVYSWAAWLTR